MLDQGVMGAPSSKIRASHLKKNPSSINQWNGMKTLIKSLFPRALMHVDSSSAALPGCNQLPSPPTPVTSLHHHRHRRHQHHRAVAPVSLPPPTSAPPPPASRLPAPLSPARGRTRGTARACAASGRHSWWSVGQADGAMVDREHEASTAVKGIFHDFCIETLYWTAVWFVGAVVLWQWCGSTTRPCVPRNLSMLHSFGFCLLC